MSDRLRVLVADDNQEMLELLRDLLEAEKCEVTLCQDGSSALVRISEERFHLIICDIAMPGASGLEVLDRVSAASTGIPLVLISGHADMESAIFALRHGAFDYLPKPFHLDEIRDLVGRVRRLHGLAGDGSGDLVIPVTGVQSNRPQEVVVKKSQALNLIASSGRVLGETCDLERLMGIVLETTMRGVGAGQGAILVSSESGDRMRVVASRGFVGALAAGDEVKTMQEVSTLAGPPFKAFSLAVPLAVRGRQVGGIVLADGHKLERFSGGADREILDILVQQASMALENASLYANIETIILEGMRSLVRTLEAKDAYTEGHSLRVAHTAVQICRIMGLPGEVEGIVRYAGALHDIGKVGIPDAILMKPGKLTPEEYERMKEHPVVGSNILMPFSFLKEEAAVVRHHHEWMSGRGYPDGLRGAEIPLPARILAVADAYDAMTTTRPYRGPRSYEAAVEELRRCAGSQFDPEAVEAFASIPRVEIFIPEGALLTT